MLLVGVLVLLRIIWAAWKSAPSRKGMIELLDSGLIAFTLVFLLIRPFVVQAFFIPSGSMEPTLLPGDRILVNKFIYRLNSPQRGDIIVFDAPEYALVEEFDPKTGQIVRQQADFVKRLIGLPGDRIKIEAGVGVFVNGELLHEFPGTVMPDYDWPVDVYNRPTGQYVVPPDSYFVLGDNRNNSRDSHMWMQDGQAKPELPKDRVLGKAMVIFWPPQRIRLLSDSKQVYTAQDLKNRALTVKAPAKAPQPGTVLAAP